MLTRGVETWQGGGGEWRWKMSACRHFCGCGLGLLPSRKKGPSGDSPIVRIVAQLLFGKPSGDYDGQAQRQDGSGGDHVDGTHGDRTEGQILYQLKGGMKQNYDWQAVLAAIVEK